MVMCKFFLNGYCRYGNNCRFDHSYNSRLDHGYNSKYSYHAPTATPPPQPPLVATTEELVILAGNDIRAAINGKQWLLTCFAPFCKKNFPGFYDVSPEEARLAIYEAKANNTVDQAIASYNVLIEEANLKFRKLLDPDITLIKTLKAVYNKETPPNPFDGSSGGFGDHSSAAKSVFGGQSSNQNVFGGQSALSTAQSVFGSQSSPQSVFGGQNNSQSVFGAQGSSQSVFGGQGGFGGQSNAQSVFGATSNPQNVFGGPSSPSNIFGEQSVNQSVSVQPSSVFGQANQSVFGSSQAPQSNVFAPQQSVGSPNQSVFSKPSENIFQQSNPQNVFGGSQAIHGSQLDKSGVFGQQSSGDTYSAMEELSPEDLEQFTGDSFVFGFIPEVPPPQALCF